MVRQSQGSSEEVLSADPKPEAAAVTVAPTSPNSSSPSLVDDGVAYSLLLSGINEPMDVIPAPDTSTFIADDADLKYCGVCNSGSVSHYKASIGLQ